MNVTSKLNILPLWWSFTWRFLVYAWPVAIAGNLLIQLFHLQDFYTEYKPFFGGINGAINAVLSGVALKQAVMIHLSSIAGAAIETNSDKLHTDSHTSNIVKIRVMSLWLNFYLRLVIYNLVMGFALKIGDQSFHLHDEIRHYNLWESGVGQLLGVFLIYIALKQALDVCLRKMVDAKGA